MIYIILCNWLYILIAINFVAEIVKTIVESFYNSSSLAMYLDI